MKYPKQVNFQMTDAQDALVTRAVAVGKVSRAEVLRECIDEAIEVVTKRLQRESAVRLVAARRARRKAVRP